jgi:hypothetical protein
VTHAVSFGLPQSGEDIIVRSGEGPLRVASAAFDARRNAAQTEEQDMRSLLREVIAIRKAGAKN